MSKKYTVEVDGKVVAEFARKDRAVREADEQQAKASEYVNVLSPSGQTVYRWEANEVVAEEPARNEKFSLLEMKAKIAKLLAKAEKTDSEEERDALTIKAERLMLRLGIEAAELEAAGETKAEEIIEARREFLGNYAITTLPGAYSVLRAFGNLTMYKAEPTYTRRIGYVVGHKTDVESFMTLLDSLMLQVMSALHVWQKANRESRRGLTDMQKYNQHRDFIEGFFAVVAKRVRSEKTEEEQTASTGAALVLASKADKVDAYLNEKHPDLKSDKRGGRSSFGDGQSYVAGREAGHTANLGEKNLPGSTKALK